MTAYKPLDGGAVVFRDPNERLAEKKLSQDVLSGSAGHREITLPCGRCIGCRIKRQEAWATRCYAESKCHSESWFVTLTYDKDHYPQYGSLNHAHWQLFAKRARRKFGPFRFFMCGEYGDESERPHYHALMFGLHLPDLSRASGMFSRHHFYESPALARSWGHGQVHIGEVNYATARYVASYTLKKINGDAAADHYSRVDVRTGEIVQLEPEYARMSLRPGVGSRWFERYWREVYVHDGVYVNDKRKPTPRYFDKLMESMSPEAVEEVQEQRRLLAESQAHDNTAARRMDKEVCAKARIDFSKQRRGRQHEI